MYRELRNLKYDKAGKDVDYKIVLEGDILKVFFLGSNSKIDWIHNFDFPITVYKNQVSPIKAHRGFVKAYKSANDAIFEKIGKIEDLSTKIVYVVGHSYGGAMSILFAEDFYFRYNIKPKVITYGSPKVLYGKKATEYVRSCCNEVSQFAHRNDIVTYMPPFPFYKHVSLVRFGKFNFFSLFNPGKYHQCYDEIN